MDLVGITDKDNKPVYVRVINNVDSEYKEKKHLFDKSKPSNSALYSVASYYKQPFANIADVDNLLQIVHVILVYQSGKKDTRYDFSLETNLLEDPSRPNIEAFPVNKLTYNVTQHVLTPKHTLLNEAEKKQVIERYNASKQMLTKISLDDSVNLYYNGKPGDIYKIEKKGYKSSYRVVVNRVMPRKK